MQPGFGVEVLAREPQIIGDCAASVNRRLAKTATLRIPNPRPIACRYLLGGAQVVVVVEVVVALFLHEQRIGGPRGSWHIAVRPRQ